MLHRIRTALSERSDIVIALIKWRKSDISRKN